MCAVSLPDKANPPLVVNTEAVLALTIPFQRLQPVSWRNAQRLQFGGSVQLQQLATCNTLNGSKAWHGLTVKKLSRVTAGKRVNHAYSLFRTTESVKRDPGGTRRTPRGGTRLRHAGTPSVEAGLRKGYWAVNRRSSNVVVLQLAPRRTQRETTWYQGVAPRETRVARGWVMRTSFHGAVFLRRLAPGRLRFKQGGCPVVWCPKWVRPVVWFLRSRVKH